ncbi:hypothetical protein MNBD_GAMMA24-435 [hydrothermal vent metagenome]|uniref:Large ribosomal RNA subunit accumulation protein YceD n=1 Tax=hydrothermal vent metagenome TaxID=652676 RepID=A0A3B1C5T5_9ZZZZ
MAKGCAKEYQRLPFRVDPFRFAHDAVELESQLPLAQMERLSAVLYQAEGMMTVKLAFAVDVLGVSSLQGRLQASLDLVCQRCLKPMRVEVDTPLALGFARSVAGLEQIPSQLEPVRVEAGQVNLLALLEDEIMLALPQIPRHAENACQLLHEPEPVNSESPRPQERENPFSVLAGLKKTD